MPVLKFWDAALQQYVPISAPASTGGPDEVSIGGERPPDNTDLWVDVDDDSGSGGGGGPDEVWIGSTAPVADEDLWVDESVEGVAGAASFVPVGSITAWAGAAAPSGYGLCDGSALVRADYSALYAVIGLTYGPGLDDGLTFSLPNLVGMVIVAAGGAYALGATGGEATHTLTEAELASHAHSVYDPGHAHGVSDPTHQHTRGDPYIMRYGDAGNHWGWMADYNTGHFHTPESVTAPPNYTGIGIAGSGTGIGVNAAGGNIAHNNMQPYLALNYIIKL